MAMENARGIDDDDGRDAWAGIDDRVVVVIASALMGMTMLSALIRPKDGKPGVSPPPPASPPPSIINHESIIATRHSYEGKQLTVQRPSTVHAPLWARARKTRRQQHTV